MNIEVYTRAGCSRCVNLKEILRNKNVEFTEHIIGETVTREEVVERFPNIKMLPIVVCDSVLTDSDKLVNLIMEKNDAS